MQDGLGNTHHCETYCLFHFRMIKSVMDQYCSDGVCNTPARALSELRVISDSGLAAHRSRGAEGLRMGGRKAERGRSSAMQTAGERVAECHEQDYYCVRWCGSFSGYSQLYDKCERSCNRNFPELSDTWNKYCSGGLCPCNT